MYKVTENDFADDISRRIFYWREKYYRTSDARNIIEMLTEDCTYYNKCINDCYEKVCSAVKSFSGQVVIYGTDVLANMMKDTLREMGCEEKFIGFCVSEKTDANYTCVESFLNTDTLILIPGGPYAYERKRHLLFDLKADSSKILLIPYTVFYNGKVQANYDFRTILFNDENHFVIYGEDWKAYLIRALFEQCKIKIDATIPEDTETLPSGCYFIVYSRTKYCKLIEKGIAESDIIQMVDRDEFQYFDPEIVPPHVWGGGNNEVFIDGGSMNLYSSEAFLDWCNGDSNKIYAFEMDDRCLEICNSKICTDKFLAKRVQIVKKALWSETTTLGLDFNNNIGSSGVKKEKEEGNVIHAISIDELVHGKKVSFIKMDIEGAELEALKGARKTIIKNKPTLAISIYHKPEDIIELPSIIKDMVPEYKLYIRNYHQDSTESVLYAIYDGKKQRLPFSFFRR